MGARLHIQTMTGNAEIDVRESFEEVLDHLYPITPPSSSLEGRQSLLYIGADTGHRLAIPQNTVVFVEELDK